MINAPRAAHRTVTLTAHVHNAWPALTSHTTSATHVLHRWPVHAEQTRGTQDASALGANPCAWEDPAVQHMGSTASSSLGTPESVLTLTNCCTEFLHVCISLPRGYQTNPAKLPLLVTKNNSMFFRLFLENPLLAIAEDETLGWKDLPNFVAFYLMNTNAESNFFLVCIFIND